MAKQAVQYTVLFSSMRCHHVIVMILFDFIGEFLYHGAIDVEDLVAGSIHAHDDSAYVLARMRWRTFTALKHYYGSSAR